MAVAVASTNTSQIIEELLVERCLAFEEAFDADCLYLLAPLTGNVGRLVRNEVEGLARGRRKRLAVFLHTLGGEIGVVERIHLILRHHYEEVAFFVPEYAYSAGTILAMSGNDIYMDYDAVLGPTDAQMEEEGSGESTSATGYLEKYREMVESSRSEDGLAPAELELLYEKFSHARMFDLEQGLIRTRKLVAGWLVQYRFKDWTKHSDGRKVTAGERARRAVEIAGWLNDARRWGSHGRGIFIDTLTRDLGLKINPIDGDETLQGPVRSYHGLMLDYCSRTATVAAIHTRNGLNRIGGVGD